MGNSMEDFIKAYQESPQRKRAIKRTNKYGGEIVRVNQMARKRLQQMVDVTKIPKRSLVSFAVAMLHDEFTKWLSGDGNANFGYEEEEKENG